MGLLGKKIGMTQLIMEDGVVVPVTVIDVAGNVVVGLRTNDKDGYEAVRVGFGEAKKMNKPEAGVFKKNNIEPKKVIREFKDLNVSEYKVGDTLTMDVLPERVSVRGISKGKGFQGTIKRYSAHRGPMKHGSKFHRAPGSLGASSFPSRVFKGKKMAGRMGGVTYTAENLSVVKKDAERNLLFVKGAVPGANGSLLYVYSSPKGRK